MNFLFQTYFPGCCLVFKTMKLILNKSCAFPSIGKGIDHFKLLRISNPYYSTVEPATKGSIRWRYYFQIECPPGPHGHPVVLIHLTGTNLVPCSALSIISNHWEFQIHIIQLSNQVRKDRSDEGITSRSTARPYHMATRWYSSTWQVRI